MLNLGDRIKIEGWVMLAKLKDGETYEVNNISQHAGLKTYFLRRVLRNKKLSQKTVVHYAKDIELWLNTNNNNRIVSI